MSLDSCEAATSRAVGVGVLVGGTGVSVLVGGTGVAVGVGDGVLVCGTGVAVGVGDGVFVGGGGVGVGSGAGAASGGGSSGAAVGVGGTGSSPQVIAAAAAPTANRHAQRIDGRLDVLLPRLIAFGLCRIRVPVLYHVRLMWGSLRAQREIPAFAGMTGVGAGITGRSAGMTESPTPAAARAQSMPQ